jgi:8-oxo-dGTP pyrophosphatase MutT (NUDIX family)
MDSEQLTTWDGQPRSSQPPFGASIIVHRRVPTGREFLLLHRAHEGPDFEGEWAWTPPAGARLPGEPIDECARRELLEEVGFRAEVEVVSSMDEEWAIFQAEVDAAAQVRLDDPEHDRFEWVALEAALVRCLPSVVGEAFLRVAVLLDA